MENGSRKNKQVSQQDYSESQNTPYCITKRFALTYGETIKNVREELKKSGFDIVCEFDVKDYLSSKIKDMPKHLILLVCEMETASKLLSTDIQLGILFPCNVTIKEVEDNSVVEVSIEDTDITWAPSLKIDIDEVAKNTRYNLKKVLDNIEHRHVKL